MRRRWRERLRTPLLILLLINAGVYTAYTLPRSLRERSESARAQVLREEVNRDRRVSATLRGRADAMESNRTDVERFYARLGSKDALSQIRAEITSLARELGLKVGALTYSPEEVKGSEGVAQFQMKMEVSGTYRELAAFLDRMERSRYFVTVDQIQLRKRAAAGQAGLDIALSAYYRSAGSAAAEEGR